MPATDLNLLFGVLALHADLIDTDRFAEACTAWAARKDTPLAQILRRVARPEVLRRACMALPRPSSGGTP